MYFSDIFGFKEFQAGVAKTIKGVSKLSDYRIKILLVRPSFVFLQVLADPKIGILPDNFEGVSVDRFFRSPIGVGPYRLSKMDLHGDYLSLKRYEYFYGRKGSVNEFVLKKVSHSSAIEGFERDEYHDLECFKLSPDEIDNIRIKKKLYTASSNSTLLLFFNRAFKEWRSLNNRKKVLSVFSNFDPVEQCELNAIATRSVVPFGVMGWLPTSESSVFPRNEMKTPDYTTRVRLLTYGNQTPPCIVASIVMKLRQNGFPNVELLHVDMVSAIKVFSKGDYDLFIETISVRGREPYNFFSFFDPESSHNLSKFNDPEVSRRISEINQTPLREVRKVKYLDLNRYLSLEKVYAVPLYTDILTQVFSANVSGTSAPSVINGSALFNQIELE